MTVGQPKASDCLSASENGEVRLLIAPIFASAQLSRFSVFDLETRLPHVLCGSAPCSICVTTATNHDDTFKYLDI